MFVKARLRERRWFDGAADTAASPAFDAALAGTRQALGLPANGGVDMPYFVRLVTRTLPVGPLSRVARGAGRSAAAPVVAAVPPSDAAPPSAPSSAARADASSGAPPARVFSQIGADGRAALRVVAASAGHLYCFAQDPATQTLRRIYPNRFVRDSHVDAGAQVSVPGQARFTLDGRQRFACLHASTDLYNELPQTLRWGDFDEVRLKSFDEIRQAFSQAAGQPVALLPAQTISR